jgi:hypothetical protein
MHNSSMRLAHRQRATTTRAGASSLAPCGMTFGPTLETSEIGGSRLWLIQIAETEPSGAGVDLPVDTV